MWPQHLCQAVRRPLLSVDQREAGKTALASSALPQTEDLGSLRKLRQLHGAENDVALESEPLEFRSYVTLCKSLLSPSPFSSVKILAVYPPSVWLSVVIEFTK